MSAETIKRIIRECVSRDNLIDAADALRATRKTAGDHSLAMGLTGREASQIAGFSAYAIQNKRLPELTLSNGGIVIEGGTFPGTELRTYQPIHRFRRVLIGVASISDPGETPSRNITRTNGAKVNVLYGSASFLPGLEPNPPTEDVIYVLLLTCRDRNDPTKYVETAIAALEPDSSDFIFYEPLDQFILGYGEKEATRPPDHGALTPLGLELKKGVAPFQGSEYGSTDTNRDIESP